ncbi:MAG: hypothetical protein GYB66_04170 [Chloroflexi bacterium]|nr:hypothetical protein [Chloroflexota bacterium]
MYDSNLTHEEREKFIRLCQAAQASVRAGNLTEARLYYRVAVQLHPYSSSVWLALAKIASTVADQQVALENVLSINPRHPEARQLLADLMTSGGSSPA